MFKQKISKIIRIKNGRGKKKKKSEGEPGEGVFNKTLATAPPLLRQCACARARACVCVPRVGNTLHDGLVPPHGHAGVLGGDDD